MSRRREQIRLLHLTDTHLFADRADRLRGTATYASLASVLEHYRSSSWRADAVLLTGDVIQDDTAAAYRRCRELLEPLALPVYCIPGNHDVRSLMQEELSSPPFRYCEPFEAAGWLVAGVDSVAAGRAGGRVTDEEQARLDALIDASGARHVMVCLHHPPVDMDSAWLDSVGLDDAPSFLAKLGESGRVRLVVFGHAHQAWDSMHEGMRILGTPSTCSQFRPQSDEFELDERPPGYRRFELHADGRFETALVWIE